MEALLKLAWLFVLIGRCSAMDCYLCHYEDGKAVLPDVGFVWGVASTGSYTSICKNGDGELPVFSCDETKGFTCMSRFYTYKDTTFYDRGCVSECQHIQEVALGEGVKMTQVCCNSHRCNHPSTDSIILGQSERQERKEEQGSETVESHHNPETGEPVYRGQTDETREHIPETGEPTFEGQMEETKKYNPETGEPTFKGQTAETREYNPETGEPTFEGQMDETKEYNPETGEPTLQGQMDETKKYNPETGEPYNDNEIPLL